MTPRAAQRAGERRQALEVGASTRPALGCRLRAGEGPASGTWQPGSDHSWHQEPPASSSQTPTEGSMAPAFLVWRYPGSRPGTRHRGSSRRASDLAVEAQTWPSSFYRLPSGDLADLTTAITPINTGDPPMKHRDAPRGSSAPAPTDPRDRERHQDRLAGAQDRAAAGGHRWNRPGPRPTPRRLPLDTKPPADSPAGLTERQTHAL